VQRRREARADRDSQDADAPFRRSIDARMNVPAKEQLLGDACAEGAFDENSAHVLRRIAATDADGGDDGDEDEEGSDDSDARPGPRGEVDSSRASTGSNERAHDQDGARREVGTRPLPELGRLVGEMKARRDQSHFADRAEKSCVHGARSARGRTSRETPLVLCARRGWTWVMLRRTAPYVLARAQPPARAIALWRMRSP